MKVQWICTVALLGCGCSYDWDIHKRGDAGASDAEVSPEDEDAGDARSSIGSTIEAGADTSQEDAARDQTGELTCADCDPKAHCDSAAERAVCTCPTGALDVSGDGTSCPSDDVCSQIACDSNATCVVSGNGRACTCNAGFEGSGSTCQNIDECASATPPCGARGTCIDSAGSYACSCNPGYSGTNCSVDACNPSPCASGLICQRSAAGASCIPACSPQCIAGDACTGDAQCGAGSTCDSTAHICLLSSCAGGTLTYQADLGRLTYCAKIEGSLSIEATANSGLAGVALPYLKTITGSLTLRTSVASLRFPALESVGGDLTGGTLQGPETFEASKLRMIGGAVTIGLATFSTVNLASLESVTGSFTLSALRYANAVNLGSLRTVGGTVTLSGLPLVPWSSLRGLSTLGTTRTVSDIGCSVCPNSTENRYMCSTAEPC